MSIPYAFKAHLDGSVASSTSRVSYSKATVFGAGIAGIATVRALEAQGVEVLCLMDNDRRKQGTRLLGYPVLSVQDAAQKHAGVKVIVASMFVEAMEAQLNSVGLTDHEDCYDLLAQSVMIDAADYPLSIEDVVYSLDLNMQKMFIRRHPGRLIVRSLDVVVTEKCSLRCRDCSNLMQFYVHPVDCGAEELLAAVQRFMASIDYLFEFRVLGGEPFVYRSLPRVVNALAANTHVGKLVLFTNGTLIPQADVLHALRHPNVTVRISDYGPLSRKCGELVDVLRREGVDCFVDRPDAWHDCARFARHEQSREATEALFANCCTNDTLTLLHGRLYHCPFSAHGQNLDALPRDPSDFVDLTVEPSDRSSLRETLRAFVEDKKSLAACSWCEGRDYRTRNAPVAVQAPAPVPYSKAIHPES